jgi:hypothetical protein
MARKIFKIYTRKIRLIKAISFLKNLHRSPPGGVGSFAGK